MDRIKKIGLFFFAAGIGGLGIQQLCYAELQPVFLSSWPAWLPGYAIFAVAVDVALAAACILILLNKNAKMVATWAAAAVWLMFIVNHLPYQIANNPANPAAWTSALKGLAISGSFFIVAGVMPGGKNTGAATALLYRLIPAGKIFFSIMLVVFGIDHFLYTEFVATLVPNWIPWHVFWTYFAGVVLIAPGVAITFNILPRLATTLLGIMLFIWLVILHIPRAVADPYSGNGNELRSVFECLAFSGVAFILARARGENGTDFRDIRVYAAAETERQPVL